MSATACSIAGRHRILLVEDVERNRVHIGRPIAPRDLLSEVDRVLREPAAGPQPDIWDVARYQEWVEKLGADRMRGVLGTLLDQFRVLLVLLEDPTEQAGDALHRRAHDVASTSGMLGFAEVTRRCRSMLEATDASAEAEARPALADVLTRSASRLDAYLVHERNAA